LDLAGLDAAGVPTAPDVVGHGDRVEPGRLGRLDRVRQRRAELGRAARPVGHRDVHAELHRLPPAARRVLVRHPSRRSPARPVPVVAPYPWWDGATNSRQTGFLTRARCARGPYRLVWRRNRAAARSPGSRAIREEHTTDDSEYGFTPRRPPPQPRAW